MIPRALVGMALAAAAPGLLASNEIMGRASVIDGDTLAIRDARIRLASIDAVEAGQACLDRSGASYPCGRRAAMALADRIGSATVSCQWTRRDRYQRLIADCFVGTTNLNGWMVEQGWAVAYLRYGGQRFASLEASARAAGRGIWQGSFTRPESYRRR